MPVLEAKGADDLLERTVWTEPDTTQGLRPVRSPADDPAPAAQSPVPFRVSKNDEPGVDGRRAGGASARRTGWLSRVRWPQLCLLAAGLAGVAADAAEDSAFSDRPGDALRPDLTGAAEP